MLVDCVTTCNSVPTQDIATEYLDLTEDLRQTVIPLGLNLLPHGKLSVMSEYI